MAKTRILLTALSTLKPEWQKGSIIDLGNGKDESTLHPQEPLLIKLKEENIKITHCITLETEKVRDDIVPQKDPSGRTSAELFKERLDYWLGDGVEKIGVSLSEDAPKEAVAQTVREIEAIAGKTGEETELYIQTNGGFRDTGLLLTSVAHALALGDEQVEPRFYAVHYQDGIGYLREDDSIRVLDLVSAMNEFFDYGRVGKSLEKYMEEKESDDLREGMSRINDGIIWGDIDTIEDGCCLLRTYFEGEKPGRKAPDDVLLQLFEERIRADLGPLLRKNCSVIDYVRWCEKKGFYQQLLVFVESRMYRDYLKAGVFTVDEEAGRVLEDYGYRDGEEKAYITLDAWLKNMFNVGLANAFPYAVFGKNYDFGNARSVLMRKMQDLRNSRNCYAASQLLGEIKVDVSLYDKNTKRSDKVTLTDPLVFDSKKTNDELTVLLYTHRVLKEIRNDASHMLGKGKDPSVKENIVRFYIKLYDRVANAFGKK